MAEYPGVISSFSQKYGGWDAADETQDGRRVLLEIPIDRWLLGNGLQLTPE
jgi:hypothetical protein